MDAEDRKNWDLAYLVYGSDPRTSPRNVNSECHDRQEGTFRVCYKPFFFSFLFLVTLRLECRALSIVCPL